MRILVCDDDERVRTDLKKRLVNIYNELVPDENISISTFGNAFGLSDYIETKRLVVDAIFMDILLSDDGEINGIDVAKKIKNEYPYVNIIFYTGSTAYAEEIFEAEPLWLLLKPASDDKIRNVLKKLIDVTAKNEYITVKKIGELRRIKVSDIYYVESQGKYVKIHTDNECVVTINKLENMKGQLGEDFICCHKSYLVNIKKVKKFDYTRLILFDDTEILVSRSYKAKIKDVFLNCI